VVDALTDADLGGGLIGHGSEREGERRESLVDFNEESSRTFHLKGVDLLELSLKDSAARVVLLGDTFAGRDEDVKSNDVASGELPFGNLLVTHGSVDDNIVTVNNVSLDLVGKDTLDSVALELLSHLLDDFGDLSVSGSLGDFALSGLEGVPGSQDNISLGAGDGKITNNGGGSGVGSVAVEMGSANAKRIVGL